VTAATAVLCLSFGTCLDMSECTAGNATPSPAPSSTRAATRGTAPAAAAHGVTKVANDHPITPSAKTRLPPNESASRPPTS